MSGVEIDGAGAASMTGDMAFVGVGVRVGVLVAVEVGVFVGAPVAVTVGVFVGVRVGELVAVKVGVFVGVRVGVMVGVLVGVDVGDAVGGAAHAGSVDVAPLQGPLAETQLDPVPQNTWPPVQAAEAIVLQAPVVVLMQQPVACASTACGTNVTEETIAEIVTTNGANPDRPASFIVIRPPAIRSCRFEHVPSDTLLPSLPRQMGGVKAQKKRDEACGMLASGR